MVVSVLGGSSRRTTFGSCLASWISEVSWKLLCKSIWDFLNHGAEKVINRFEDAELALPNANEEESEAVLAAGQIPHWALARQRFSKRQMAYISPRLGLLNNLPMAVPFQTRLEVFRQFVQ